MCNLLTLSQFKKMYGGRKIDKVIVDSRKLIRWQFRVAVKVWSVCALCTHVMHINVSYGICVHIKFFLGQTYHSVILNVRLII